MAPMPGRSRRPESREWTRKVSPLWLAPRFAPDPPESYSTIQTDSRIRSSSSREVSLKVSRTSPVVGLIDSMRSEEHTSELQSHSDLVCRLLLEKKKKKQTEQIK